MAKSPMDLFFSLGDKATGGDFYKKALFDYYFLWIIFVAFFVIGFRNAYHFFNTFEWSYLGWTFVMLGILWFQYFGLKQARAALKILEERKRNPHKVEDNISSVDDMIKGFERRNNR